MDKIGIGIIGCGIRIGQVAKGLVDINKDVEIVALSDPCKKSVDSTKEKFGCDPAVYQDYRDLVNDPAVKWVFIGSWNCFHREHIEAALQSGKQIFCEKPLATSFEDCIRIYERWKNGNSTFMIGFTLRYSPHYNRIKELIDAGEIGDIVSLEFNETLDFNHGSYIMGGWRSLTKNAGTHLLEKCCHDIDIINWLTGSRAIRCASFGGLNVFKRENVGWMDQLPCNSEGCKPFQSWGQPYNPFLNEKDIVDNQVVILEYGNGIRATFHTNCCCGIPERRMYIVGTHGCIRSDTIKGLIELKKVGFDTVMIDCSTDVAGNHGGGDEVLCKFLSQAINEGKAPPTGMLDALNSAITCFGIDESLERGIVFDYKPLWEKAERVVGS